MCGISGIFTKQNIEGKLISDSLKSIKHRGPDNSLCASYTNNIFRFYSNELSNPDTSQTFPSIENESSNNWIGFNRLSIIDLSNNGMQPFYDEVTHTAFMLNGEVYNFKELRKNYLREEKFRSDSDTEVAFKLYLKFGDEFIHKIRGMFSIVVVDYKKQKLKIWRDRFGIKPLYYYTDKEKFIFSSEMRGIFETGLIEKIISEKHLAHIYYLQSTFAPNTLYKNVYSLEAGSKIEVDFQDFTFQKDKYWTLEYVPQDQEIGQEEFLSDLDEIVRLASLSDVKQAIMLSGGLDSGIMAHFLKKNTSDIQAITIYNQGYDQVNEYEFAKITAEKNRIEFLSIEIPNSIDKKIIYEYATSEEEPSNSPEATYFLSKEAVNRYDIKVLHNALGLDELFYGYKYYTQALHLQKFSGLLNNRFKYFLKGKKRYKYDELTQMGIFTLPLLSKSPLSWKEILELFDEDWEHPANELIKQAPTGFYDMPLLKQLSWIDFHYYISSYHSMRSDQSSMKNSVEMRFPFLDHLFVQKYFNQSYLHKNLSYKNNKPFLRKNAKGILDDRIFSMAKKGFSIPREIWIDGLSDFPSEIAGLNEVFGSKDLIKWADTSDKKWQLFSTAQILKA